MYATSARFLTALRSSHTARSRLDVVQGDDTATFAITDGSVTYNYDSPTRRSLDVTIVDDVHTPAELDELLHPLLAVLRPYRGVRYDDGTEELVPLGVFFPEPVKLKENDAGGITVQITAYDASTRCQGGLDRPLYIPSGTTFDQAIPDLLSRKMPTLTYRLASTPWTTPTLLLRGQTNPWAKAQELYEAAGFDLSIDRDGVCESLPRVVTVADEPVWDFVEGAGATSKNLERDRGAEDYPNVVVVKSTNSANGRQVRGEAADEDPASPTYRYGAGGERVLEVESEKVRTEEQAAAMARLILSRELGPQEQITFTAVCNPALDVPDVVAFTRERLNLQERRMILSQLQIPFKAGVAMTGTARRSVLTDGAGTPVRT